VRPPFGVLKADAGERGARRRGWHASTSHIGAGLKWYATDSVGLRFDYRLIGIAAGDDSPVFMATDDTRFAN
jgi:hypothetical protein